MIWLAGCTATPSPHAPPPAASCTIDAQNGLRGTCELTLAAPGRARVVLEAEGEEPKLFRSDTLARHHAIDVWGLPPSTDFAWTAIDEGTGAAATGTLRTGDLPEGFDTLDLRLEQRGPEPQVEALLVGPSCPAGLLWMVDRRGRIVWWDDPGSVGGRAGPFTAVAWTEDGTVLALAGRERLIEVATSGELLLDLRRGRDFVDEIHHDLTRKDGFTYVPHSHAVQDQGQWVEDGIYVFGPDGALVEDLPVSERFPRVIEPWMQSGYWFQEFPLAVDTTHVNGIHVDDQDELWVSMRHMSAVARFTGGPGTDAFGALDLLTVGEEASPLWSSADLVPDGGDDVRFSGQHDPHLADDGSIWMLDNRMLLPGTARAVHYAVDEDRGLLTQQESWDTRLTCPVEGGARELPGGDVIVTCAAEPEVFEFAPGRSDPVWSIAPTCGFGEQLSRAVPVDLP